MSSKTDKQSQVDKFKDLARELETDESEEHFDRALKRVARVPVVGEDEKRRKKKDKN